MIEQTFDNPFFSRRAGKLSQGMSQTDADQIHFGSLVLQLVDFPRGCIPLLGNHFDPLRRGCRGFEDQRPIKDIDRPGRQV